MKAFMNEDFLLSTNTAKELYHNFAEKMPIIDYHAIFRLVKSQKTEDLKILHRYGLEETIINGVRCAQTE